jgi:NADH dehydrogenase
MRIAITGVTGFIGRRLATRALESGHDVTAFSRRAWTGAPNVALVDRRVLDLPERPEPGVLDGADALVHLAIAPQSAPADLVDAVNRLGSIRLFEAANAAGVGRLVFVSSQSAHAGATSAYGRTKYAVEQWLADDPRAVIVRPGLVYGDSDDGLMGRAAAAAAKLRVFPVIGGRAAVAQPIHVDALCDALLELAAATDPPRVVELADPEVRPLGDLVQRQARERFGVTTYPVNVPLGLARAGVKVATALKLPSPITEENLDGIASFEPMDTRADMDRLGVAVDHGAPIGVGDDDGPSVEPRRLILVGAGRIGLVHALTAAHHQRMVLVGIVDLDKGAIGRVTSLAGPTIPAFTDLDEAVRVARPDAAIIGTPPSSHVPLAKKLMAAGIDVLVEKPVAASVEDRDALAAAADEHPDRYVGTGYLSGLLPHLAAIAPELRKGRFGTPQRFDARAFVTRVDTDAAEQQEMWELDPSISGGGALVNLGVHVLAMLDVLLGPIEVDDAVLVAAPGRATEDGAALELRAGGVPGRFATAWHLPGFDMPENHLRIDTDRGVVVCTTSCAAFIGDDEVHVVHQVDADRGFDLAPMDAGGAFWAEQDLLARREDGPNSLELAARIEDAITHVYETATRVDTPRVPVAPVPVPDPRGNGRVVPDLRGAPAGATAAWVGPALVGTRGLGELGTGDAIVALPDAPGHFRTLTNQGPVALVKDLGFGPLARAGFGMSPLGAATAGGRPWEVLLVLLRAELKRVPRTYRGALVVDAYLVDLATATGHIDAIGAALDDLRGGCPGARVGIEVNATGRLVPQVAAIASNLDVVVALGSPAGTQLGALRELLPSTTELVVKTGVLPRELLELAWDEPERWSPTDRLVVHWPGAPGLRDAHRDATEQAAIAAGLGALSTGTGVGS